ncbi:glutamate--cysteine ligase [Polaromonas sp.]|jgi:glutamate--cysteine ligase|uniref:glutamate--cysteine ligase n=1 Tax=Polaromonas sp. TaxID=1869339 RepID=UPI002C361D53|nr:glutamate--cysteine ligase [Polaromonas sp.]HQS30979.1 glutamate--cysteine ligase [Polaromonas sp.]HQS90142.1 glutamate--cysteine ligase [Polaromonas sp.]
MAKTKHPPAHAGTEAGSVRSQHVQALKRMTPARLKGMRCGIEKESLRAQPGGALALTPHPAALGSALTHPSITTDFSESQVELVTGVHGTVDAALDELTQIHQFTYRAMKAVGDEMLWVSSMPCGLPTDETIPVARFGSSNVGRAKSVYRLGLSHRYGRRMQTISGIHYNWSFPGVTNDDYFGLIRNFRRQAFLLLYLFGASPAVCSSFVAGRQHELQRLSESTMYMRYGTSLRMSRLGYQSDAQASLAVSYNSLDGYAASLHDALTRGYPAYEKVGIRNPGGDYNQLGTTLLQIENEFYGTIRPKRVIFPGERPLHALRERGVEYIEVRLMDLDPFEPVGITTQTMRFLDVFLLHCLLSDSPPDTPQEIASLARNQHRTAARGREPGLLLDRAGQEIKLTDWGLEILAQCSPIAEALDAAHSTSDYTAALEAARAGLEQPDTLPSARVLAVMAKDFDNSFVQFARAQSRKAQAAVLALPFSEAQQARFQALAQQSVVEQKTIENADSMPFEIYREKYLSAERLGQPRAQPVHA